MRDAYERFSNRFSISLDDLFEFGLAETIRVPVDVAALEWAKLKQRIQSNEAITIRSYGSKGSGSHLFVDLILNIFGNANVEIDTNNNYAPTRVLENHSGYSKKGKKGCVSVRNYQVSHVFGRTKNSFAFTAPWNIVFLPKIIDTFTGHEAKGEASVRFQRMFQRHIFDTFEPMIDDFNSIVSNESLRTRIDEHLCVS